MRAAAARAAIRRGSEHHDLPSFRPLLGGEHEGTRVVFSGARRRDEHRGVRSAQCGSQLGQSGIDGKARSAETQSVCRTKSPVGHA